MVPSSNFTFSCWNNKVTPWHCINFSFKIQRKEIFFIQENTRCACCDILTIPYIFSAPFSPYYKAQQSLEQQQASLVSLALRLFFKYKPCFSRSPAQRLHLDSIGFFLILTSRSSCACWSLEIWWWRVASPPGKVLLGHTFPLLLISWYVFFLSGLCFCHPIQWFILTEIKSDFFFFLPRDFTYIMTKHIAGYQP